MTAALPPGEPGKDWEYVFGYTLNRGDEYWSSTGWSSLLRSSISTALVIRKLNPEPDYDAIATRVLAAQAYPRLFSKVKHNGEWRDLTGLQVAHLTDGTKVVTLQLSGGNNQAVFRVPAGHYSPFIQGVQHGAVR